MARIVGLESWNRWMDSIPEEVAQEVKDTVSTNAYKIEADAKMNAPVDTGNLRRSISTNIENGGFTATVGTNVDYAGFVEFGTSKMNAQPFLIPAYINWKDIFERELKSILNRVGR